MASVTAVAQGHLPPLVVGAGEAAAAAVPTFSPQSVGRIAVHGLGSSVWQSGLHDHEAQEELVQSVLCLKMAVHQSRWGPASRWFRNAAVPPALRRRRMRQSLCACCSQFYADDRSCLGTGAQPWSR